MTALRISAPVADLFDAPGGVRVRQKLLGEPVQVLATQGQMHQISASDGYQGWVSAQTVAARATPTHRVANTATHLYDAPDVKGMGPAARSLPFGAQLRVTDERQHFFETDDGFVPKKHLRPLDRPFADPVTVAQLFFHTPYLWGGNSSFGIDCSGLVQTALAACDIPCPGDSGPQRDTLGVAVSGSYQRGDLVFWQGHVGMMVDAEVMIHANAHHMAVVYEPIAAATLRIAAQGDGPVVAHKRFSLSSE